MNSFYFVYNIYVYCLKQNSDYHKKNIYIITVLVSLYLYSLSFAQLGRHQSRDNLKPRVEINAKPRCKGIKMAAVLLRKYFTVDAY